MKPREINFNRPNKIVTRVGLIWLVVTATVFSGFWVWTGPDYAKEVVVVNSHTHGMSVGVNEPTPRFTILDKIEEGKELLRKSAPLDYETKYYTVKKGIRVKTGDPIRKQVVLAVLNKETGEVYEQRIWVKEQEIKNYKKTGLINPEPVAPANSLNGVTISWWNSFNTFYEFPDNPELVVIANKYLFPSKYLAGLAEKSKNQFTDIIYAPYSKDLHVPELVEAGKKYIDENIERAFTELDLAKVKSRFVNGAMVTDGISKDFIKNIMVIEHMDPDGFKMAADGGLELSERVLVVIGSNQGYAYRYTGSPAGASGLAQFISSTYKNIAGKYPEAKLVKDYNAGMANHVNAVKAMVLFFDAHKKDIAGRVTRKDIVKSLGITEEMLAAAYNGGPGRVVTSVNKFGLAWISGQLNASVKNRVFRNETIDYIKKFRAIKVTTHNPE